MDIEACAQLAHQINRAYCYILGDTSQLPWERAPEWQRDSAREGVQWRLDHLDAPVSESHVQWLAHKKREGWSYGETKNPSKKTHPCYVPFDALPEDQQLKDHLFVAVVRAYAAVYL